MSLFNLLVKEEILITPFTSAQEAFKNLAEKRLSGITSDVPECFGVEFQSLTLCRLCPIEELCGVSLSLPKRVTLKKLYPKAFPAECSGYEYGSVEAWLLSLLEGRWYSLEQIQRECFKRFKRAIEVQAIVEKLEKGGLLKVQIEVEFGDTLYRSC